MVSILIPASISYACINNNSLTLTNHSPRKMRKTNTQTGIPNRKHLIPTNVTLTKETPKKERNKTNEDKEQKKKNKEKMKKKENENVKHHV